MPGPTPDVRGARIGADSIVFGALLLALAHRLRRASAEHRVPIVRAA